MLKFTRGTVGVGGVAAVAALGISASLALGGTDNKTAGIRAGLDGTKPKNVIFFLGDGMGTQEITEARYYRGAANKLNVDRLPFTGFDETYSVKADGTTPDYDPDSAATGTQWATGKRTTDDRDSQAPSPAGTVGDNTAYKTALEYAQEAGKKVGNVTTADITDATPAVLAAHISNRNCSGPDNMTSGPAATPKCVSEGKQSAGGLGSIAEQEADHKMDVALGGGVSRFQQTITGGPDTGKTVIKSAQDKGINVVTDTAGLTAADASKPVLGLFGPATGGNAPNMSLEWKGATAALGDGSPAEKCLENQRPANEPSLPAMTQKSLDLLDNPKGFFLQVEGASIDKQDHAANACQQIGETIAFDNAIGVALDYQKTHPDTLIVVTADHGHSSQIVAEDTTGTGRPTGYSNSLMTADGQIMKITYGTAGYNGAGNPPVTPSPADPTATPPKAAVTIPSMQHTGTVVPVWGGGPQAANILGTNAHTDLFDLLRFNKDDQPAPPATTVTAPGTTTPGPATTTPGATVTVQGPSTVTPDLTPRLGVAAIRSVTAALVRGTGLPVAVTAVNVSSVKLSLRHGTKTVATKTIKGSATTTLRDKSAKKGTYSLRATGSGKTVTYKIAIK